MPKAKIRLTPEEKRELLIALSEMEARELDLPEEAKSLFKSEKVVWPVDDRGYFVRRDGHLFKPYGDQESFIDATQRYVLLRSGRGGGKTASGSQKALKKIQQGFSGAVINPVFSDFVDSTWQEFKQWIPWDMVIPSHRRMSNDGWQPNKGFRLAFTNGAFVICKGLKNPESARGPNINWAWYDEGRNDPTGVAWKNLIASVRIGYNPQAWCTTTPVGISHWMYDFFEERNVGDDVKKLLDELGFTLDDLTASFHGSIEDNKENLDPMFYASILTSYPSGYLRDREVFGEYSDAGGKIGDARWFDGKIVTEPLPEQVHILRYWDLAATEKKQAKDDPDETVGSLLSEHKNPEGSKPLFMIQNQVYGRWGADKVFEVIANTARKDGPFVKVIVEQEPAASGKITIAAIQEYFKRFPELSGYTVEGLPVRNVGDRVEAANRLWFSVAAEGRMYMIEGIWNRETLKQLDGFGNPKIHDDRITSITNGMFILNPYKNWKTIEFITT